MKSKVLATTEMPSANLSGGTVNINRSENSKLKSVVDPIIFYFLIFISLGAPNLIYSGISWFDTLHIMKWTFAMVPVAIISAIGISLALYGNERTGFRIDLFGFLWLIMLGYISIQTMWVDISSWSTYMKEWFFANSDCYLYFLIQPF